MRCWIFLGLRVIGGCGSVWRIYMVWVPLFDGRFGMGLVRLLCECRRLVFWLVCNLIGRLIRLIREW